jgi:hypothetical protein
MQKEESLSLVQILNEYPSARGDVGTNLAICKKAIEQAANISTIYGYHQRIIEPFLIGNHRMSGNKVLVAWHVYGFSYSQNKPQWRMYRLDKMTETKIRPMAQRKNRPLFNPNDSRLSSIDISISDFYTTGESDNFTLQKIKQLVKDKFGINSDSPSFMNKLKTSISKFLNLKR